MYISITRAALAASAMFAAVSPALAGPQYRLSPETVAAAHGAFYPAALTDFGLAAGNLAAADGTLSAYYGGRTFSSDNDFCAGLGAPGTTSIKGISRDPALTYSVGTCKGQNFSFMYDHGSNTITAVTYPGAFSTFAYGVNEDGVAVGEWSGQSTHGFALRDGKFTSIDAPGAAFTAALGINARNIIFGDYDTQSASHFGFVIGANGAYTTIDYPGSTRTGLIGLNSQNLAVGFYEDAAHDQHAFAWRNGSYFALNLPAAASSAATAVNESGVVTGWYLDASGNQSGFVWRPATGKVVLVKGPKGSRSAEVTALNDTHAQITGSYTAANGQQIGFIGSCRGTGCF